jgi:flagellar biosynthesis/type III secretory pathway M-ring protein FliF/YscJ
MEKTKLTFKERLSRINFFYLKGCISEPEEEIDEKTLAKMDREEKIILGIAGAVVIILCIVLIFSSCFTPL